MRAIFVKTLKQFWEKPDYLDSEQALKAWYAEAKASKWKSSADIKVKYGSASFVGNNRVVFNIKGNKYRLIVAFKYDFKIVYIRLVGTHKQYDEIDARNV